MAVDYDRIDDPEHRGTGFHQLSGMVDRANDLANALVGVGFATENIKTLFNEDATSGASNEQTLQF